MEIFQDLQMYVYAMKDIAHKTAALKLKESKLLVLAVYSKPGV